MMLIAAKVRQFTRVVPLLGIVACVAIVAAQDEASTEAPKRFPAEWHWTQSAEQLEQCYKLVGQKAPKPATHRWLVGTPSSEELENKIILIDFWATWCRPCIDAIPHNNELLDRYADQGVRIIGICASRGAEQMSQVVQKHKMRYPTTRDVYNQTATGYGVQWLPYYVIIDREGVVRGAGIQPAHVEDAILALLEEQPANDSPEPADHAGDHDHADPGETDSDPE